MREREVIEREMYRAREDLEQSLAELRHVVTEKIDIPARARVAVARGKIAAQDAIEHGKDLAVDLMVRGKVAATSRPILTGAIIGGVVAAGALVYIGRQRDWW